MPSKTASRDAASASTSNLDDLDNFFLDGDDDPFASPPPGDKTDSAGYKRKSSGDGLGLDEEVSVAKKARVPRIKLDQDRLLSQKGIPALRRRARGLKLKGKGHEWGDASRLLSFYQDWLDDLFPKAKFLDALGMVEKAGHNKMLQKQRVDWINEGKPKSGVIEDGGDVDQDEQPKDSELRKSERVAPIFEKTAEGSRPRTPELDDLFGDGDDIYNATPLDTRKKDATTTGGEPDEDELDALMAEAEASGPRKSTNTTGAPINSIFGDGKPIVAKPPPPQQQQSNDGDDELDALMAEAEAEQASRQKPNPGSTAINGSRQTPENNDASGGGDDDEGDDLDALMAEADAQPAPSNKQSRGASISKPGATEFNDDEEAMAEMDGLW